MESRRFCATAYQLALAAAMIALAGACSGRGAAPAGPSVNAAADSCLAAEAARLLPGGKVTATPPRGDANLAWQVEVAPGTSITVAWRGRHRGDYNLDGKVDIADVTPIAMHFGAQVDYELGVPVEDGDNEYRAQVDGNSDGTVNIADVTPLAQHFGEVHAGYRLYLGLRAQGETEFSWSSEFLRPLGEPTAAVSVPYNTSRSEGQVQRYEFSFNAPADFVGAAALRIAASDGETDGATYETSPFSLNTGPPDTEPPYYVSGQEGLGVQAGIGAATLSWGEWADDDSPPVVIDLAWGPAPLGDPGSAPGAYSLSAGTQQYEVTGLDNGVEYEFTCRFRDSAAVPNYTGWLPAVAATPQLLFSVPPPGAEQVSTGSGLSPSLAVYNPAENPPSEVFADYAPVVAYVAIRGATDRPLMLAGYYSGWHALTVAEGEFSSCSQAIVNGSLVAAAVNHATNAIEAYCAGGELSNWEMETIHAGIAPAVKLLVVRSPAGEVEYLCAGFVVTTGGESAFHLAWKEPAGAEWKEAAAPAVTDTIFDFDLAATPGLGTVEVLLAHGTAEAQQLQLTSTVRHLRFSFAGESWTEHDYSIPPVSGNERNPLSVALRPDLTPPFWLAAAGAVRFAPSVRYDIPYGDLLVSNPTDFSTQPAWSAARLGTTGLNPLPPPSITLDWAGYPVWTGEQAALRMLCVRIRGNIQISLDPLGIVGGTVAPEWLLMSKAGSEWISGAPAGNPPGGLAPDAAATNTGASMVYLQVDTIDLESLLGGGAAPSGPVYYWRE